jgi:hypothetical protein
MTPREYLDAVCRPNLDEFVCEPTSIRKAWSAAASLFHFADCLAVYRRQRVVVVRKELSSQLLSFSALADIANAGKHFQLNRGSRAGLSADHFHIASGAAFSDGTYYSDGASHSDAPDVVRLEFQGNQLDVLHLCQEALKFLESKLI